MKKLYFYFLTAIFFLGLVPLKARASHCIGSELVYEWVQDSTYRVYYKFYRDCANVAELDSVQCCIHNKCNPSLNFNVFLYKVTAALPDGLTNGSEVQKTCPGISTNCTSPGSAYPGFREWWYTNLVTLPARCNSWEFTCSISARSGAVTNLMSLGNLWVGASLDNVHFQGDTSPFFSVQPVPVICNNSHYNYNGGVVDVNGDSLDFQLTYPSNGALCDTFGTPSGVDSFEQTGTPPGYPYNIVNNPLQSNNSFTLNHQNGAISFTPSASQAAVVDELVRTYRGGRLIGYVMRDMMITVRNCPSTPATISSAVTSLTGATLDSHGNITTCAGNSFSFKFLASSPDLTSIMTAIDNHAQATPGATVTYARHGTADSLTANFSWTPSASDTGLRIFTVSVYDSMCRTSPGIIMPQTYTFAINIRPTTTAFRDTSIYSGDTVHLSVMGGGSFSWSVVPGGSSIASLSCTSCNSPVASPTATTEYVVTSNVTGCRNTDTVIVTIIPGVPNRISGSVSTTSTAGNPASPVCKVWLIVHDTSANTLTAIDSTTVTGSAFTAYYQFMNKPAGIYLIKAALTNGPSSGSGPAPSYDSSSLYWDSARNVVYSGTGRSSNNNIFMPQGIVTSGPGFVGGNITSGANKGTHVTGSPVYNMLVFLKNAANHLVGFTYTDVSGNYAFSNLPVGFYTVYPEAQIYKTTPSLNINVSTATPRQTSIDFIEHTLSKTITPVTTGAGVSNVADNKNIFIYPNPTTGIVNISWSQMPDQAAMITITDVVGRTISVTPLNLNNTAGKAQFDLSSYKPGLYFINMKAGEINFTEKVLLQH